MASIPLLYALQEIDLALDSRRAELESDRQLLGETEELLAARQAVEQAASHLRELEKEQRELEARVEDTKATVEPLERRLYEGSIRNPKELQELDHQVNTLKSMQAEREARLLEHMAALEGANRGLEQGRADLRRIEADWQGGQKRLRREIAGLEREVAALESRRAVQAHGIDPATLAFYDGLRPRTGGRAIARVERGMCGGCRISLPLNVLNRSRGGSAIVQCTSCGRILLAT